MALWHDLAYRGDRSVITDDLLPSIMNTSKAVLLRTCSMNKTYPKEIMIYRGHHYLATVADMADGEISDEEIGKLFDAAYVTNLNHEMALEES